MLIGGSSPRVRGTAGQSGIDAAHHRFIPAGAGNGTPVSPLTKDRPVHPRGCGERAKRSHADAVNVGSSPRVRGTDRGTEALRCVRRFIPAGAGNGSSASRSSIRGAVHPRGCGERPTDYTDGGIGSGSSPRVRGTGRAARSRSAGSGFIPAGAGNGAGACASGFLGSVHPRGCVERTSQTARWKAIDGSSPRVRGTGAARQRRLRPRRFIPAGAGNGGPGIITRQIHSGSSPRVRGTARAGPRLSLPRRFIPAGAGNGRRGRR